MRDHEAEIQCLKEELRQTKNTLEECANRLILEEDKNRALLNSLSWRITGPLRRLFQLLSAHTSLSLESINGLLLLIRYPVHYLKQAGRMGMGHAFRLLISGNLDRTLKQVADVRRTFKAENVCSTHLIDILKSSPTAVFPSENEPVDVIVPIHNAYELAVQCIESVLKHTRNIQLMIVNDASTDPRIGAYLENLKPRTDNGIKPAIITNETNLGFVRSVNKALRKTNHHVVILNSDTEVPAEWLPRLIAPIRQNERIATVTPFSNSATICSFPTFDADNPLFNGLPLETVDGYFRLFGGETQVPLPTGIGFCMAINRSALDRIGLFDEDAFRQGYGEENDFCRRAAKAGYSNVLAPNLFVYHKHCGSFSPSDKERILFENHEKLIAKHPDYQSLIENFIRLDPLHDMRETMKILIDVLERGGAKHYAVIDHDIGGGANLYRRELMSVLSKQGAVTTLCYDHRIKRCSVQYLRGEVEGAMTFDPSFIPLMMNFLELTKADHLFINELTSWPEPLDCVHRIEISGIPYSVFMHDFFFACPNMNLTDTRGKFCRYPETEKPCTRCLNENKDAEYRLFYPSSYPEIETWRRRMESFLSLADRIIFFSENSKEVYSRFYPHLANTVVSAHFIPDLNSFSSRLIQFNQGKTFNVAVVGEIGPSKGIEVLSQFVSHPDFASLPIKLIVLGITSKFPAGYVSAGGKFLVHGSYRRAELSDLLAQYDISAVLIPSVWPETFSYTTSEAMLLGYPVICFDLGAPANRIRRHNCGLVVSDMSANGLLAAFRQILDHPQWIEEFSRNTGAYNPPTKEKHFAGIPDLCPPRSPSQKGKGKALKNENRQGEYT